MSGSGEPPPIESGNLCSKTTTAAGDDGNRKRGMRPRSKRNRKRARSERHALEEVTSPNVHIRPLELDGRPIHAGTRTWIRAVEPYPHTFSTFAKSRWLGRTILDVYCTEFGSYPKSYYESAIAQGRILLSDQTVSAGHIIRGGDVLTHTVHRHEPGVAVSLQDPPHLHVLQETEHLVVVDKPGTLPIHPCGGYHMQSLMTMLEPTFGKLYTIHRLDRLTSGLVILGKTSAIAKELGKAIMDRNCEKVYLARVAGKFPMNMPNDLTRFQDPKLVPDHGEFCKETDEQDKSMDPVALARKQNASGYWITNQDGELQGACQINDVFASQHNVDEWLGTCINAEVKDLLWFHLACPTRVVQHKDGICEAGNFEDLDDAQYSKTVKPAETAFRVVRYDPATDSTVVICRPRTGRTHQIRLHLQHLGHPIANDPNYGGDIWYGNLEGKEACRIAQERLDAIAITNQPHEKTPNETSNTTDCASTATIDVPATEGEIQRGVSAAVRRDNENIHGFIQRTCVWCARSRNTIGKTPRDVLEFLVRSPGIWLHAFQYTFEDAKGGAANRFCAPIPQWAEPSTDSSEGKKDSS